MIAWGKKATVYEMRQRNKCTRPLRVQRTTVSLWLMVHIISKMYMSSSWGPILSSCAPLPSFLKQFSDEFLSGGKHLVWPGCATDDHRGPCSHVLSRGSSCTVNWFLSTIPQLCTRLHHYPVFWNSFRMNSCQEESTVHAWPVHWVIRILPSFFF